MMINRKNLFKILTILLVIVVAQLPLVRPFVYADDVSDIQNEIDRKNNEKNNKESILAQTQKEIDDIANSNISVDAKISLIDGKISSIEGNLNEKDLEIKKKEAEINKRDEKIKETQQDVDKLSVRIYKESKADFIEVFLSDRGNGDLIRSLVLKKYIANSNISQVNDLNQEVRDINKQKESIESAKKELAAEKLALDESRAALVNEKARIQAELANQAAIQAAIQAELASINNQIANLSAGLQDAINSKTGGQTGDNTGGGNSNGGTTPQPPSSGTGSYDIYVDGQLISSGANGAIRLSSANSGSGSNVFRVNGSWYYRGTLEFRSDSDVYMINELPLEMYMRGIGEMPSSWPIEALKAQAAAARTYAAKNWSKRSGYNYNLRDDIFDQNYVGVSKEVGSYGSNWVSAVDQTKNKVIFYNGDMISAYYHSTCGGHTLASSEVWGGTLGYAVAMSDRYESGGIWRSYDESSPWSYKKWGNSSINNDQVADILNAAIYLSGNIDSSQRQNEIRRPDLGGLDAGSIQSLLGGESVQSRIGSMQDVKSIYNDGDTSIGRDSKKTQAVRVFGTNGTIDVDGDAFWIVFNARSPGDNTLYYSNLWESKLEGGSWNFYSLGYPHRVGMCQYGAYGRANAGQGYQTILSAYYNGANIGDFNAPEAFRVGITRVSTGDVTVTSDSGDGFDIYAHGEKITSVSGNKSVRIVKR